MFLNSRAPAACLAIIYLLCVPTEQYHQPPVVYTTTTRATTTTRTPIPTRSTVYNPYAGVPVVVPTNPRPLVQCVCVPHYLCDAGNVITDGHGVIDPRKDPQPVTCPPDYVCCTAPKQGTPKSLPIMQNCGIAGMVDPKVITRGTQTQEGQYPWQVALLRKEEPQNVFLCGGVLVHPRVMLTVVHSVQNVLVTSLVAHVGDYNLLGNTEKHPSFDMDVAERLIHPNYDQRNLHNDIALLIFTQDVPTAPNIVPVCLPPATADSITDVTVTGWGKDAFGSKGSFSAVLRHLDMKVLSNNDCQSKLRLTRLGDFFNLHPGFVCAIGLDGKDSCEGDGGGPLVYVKDGRTILRGLVAWGVGCGMKDVPGVYMDVQKYLTWIHEGIDKADKTEIIGIDKRKA